MLYGLILAGGMGKRLWPESDDNTPKQFLSRGEKRTLLEETLSRLLPLIPPDRILISTTSKFTSQTKRLLNDERINVISEPFSRNTAPAIALAALNLFQSDPDAVMAVLPSDHFIDNADAFRLVLKSAADLIDEDPTRLVTVGIVPRSPVTGYGYIKATNELLSGKSIRMFAETTPLRAEFFTEKPDRAIAEKFINEGGFYWNSGIFVWKVSHILNLITRNIPQLEPFVNETVRHSPTAVETFLDAFSSLPSISIDKGVMEKARNILLIPAPFGWSDLGTFEILSHVDCSTVDVTGNSVLGATVISSEASENIIRVTLPERSDPFTVAIGGVDRLLVVLKGNRLLIVPQGRDDLVQRLADGYGFR